MKPTTSCVMCGGARRRLASRRRTSGQVDRPPCHSSGLSHPLPISPRAGGKSLADADLAVAHRGLSSLRRRLAPAPLSGPPQTFIFHVSHPPAVAFATGVFPWQAVPTPSARRSAFFPRALHGVWALARLPHFCSQRHPRDRHRAGNVRGRRCGGKRVDRQPVDVVSRYYGPFPVTRPSCSSSPAKILVRLRQDARHGGASIVVPVGEKTTRAALADDWVLVHEMIHLAFPDLPRDKLWLSEGLATYVEPLARARTRRLSPKGMEWARARAAQRASADGDQGLDRTHTWGRTYWGGALFCFLADVEIRKRTANRRSLDDALRAILLQGATPPRVGRSRASSKWAIGRPGYGAFRALWQDGHQSLPGRPRTAFASSASARGRGVKFDDSAPLRLAAAGDDQPRLTLLGRTPSGARPFGRRRKWLCRSSAARHPGIVRTPALCQPRQMDEFGYQFRLRRRASRSLSQQPRVGRRRPGATTSALGSRNRAGARHEHQPATATSMCSHRALAQDHARRRAVGRFDAGPRRAAHHAYRVRGHLFARSSAAPRAGRSTPARAGQLRAFRAELDKSFSPSNAAGPSTATLREIIARLETTLLPIDRRRVRSLEDPKSGCGCKSAWNRRRTGCASTAKSR